jgi:hypothetical protein
MSAFIDWLNTDSAEYVSFIMVILCAVVSLQNVIMHLVNYSRDDLQRHVTRIILVVPIYTTASWLEITHPELQILCHAVVDFWEALVIYSFFNLILEYVGGEHNWLVCVQHTHPEGLAHPFPFNLCFCKPMQLNPDWMRKCKIACFQFVLIKPLVGILSLPMVFSGTYHDPPWPTIRDVIYNITYTVAMYALALLYMTTHEHPSLKPKRPLAKFATVKLVIFFTYWQRYLLYVFDLTDEEMTNVIAFLTMVEMTLVAIPLNWVAFPWREFQTGILDTSSMAELIETGQNSPSEKLRAGVHKFNSVVGNAIKIFSPEDMVEKANQNLSSKYKTHVLLESSQEYVIEDNPVGDDSSPGSVKSNASTKKKKRVFKAKTYLIGGLDTMSPRSDGASSVRSLGSPSATNVGAAADLPAAVIGQPLETLPESPRENARTESTNQSTSVVVPLLPMPGRNRGPQFVRLEEELDEDSPKNKPE